ncbi:MAG: hypothetical protein PF961_08920 [Planctomycetota bacterium]|jgi:hypothetical protein|nr:hypothetical protein [Planctomycetota bacterium]
MSDCIAAVTQPEMTDTEVDDDTISLESEYVVDWTDHLTAVVEARLRKYVPRDVVHTAPADPEYCETLTEATVVINGHTVDQVGLALLEPKLAPRADIFTGTLRTAEALNGTRLTLTYRHLGGDDWLYCIQADERHLKGFRNSALADIALEVLAYTPGADWERLLLRTIRVFYKSYAHIEGETLDEDEKARFHHFVA